MNKKIVWLILSCLMVSVLVLTSCGGEEEEVTVPTEEEKEVEGDWWNVYGEPQYGGTITYPLGGNIPSLDPAFRPSPAAEFILCYETLGDIDWSVDRKIFDFRTMFRPDEYRGGLLAESWDTPDLETVIFHIRKGIHWQDKPPVNGREFTAYDVEYHFHRLTGTGSGFTEAVPGLSTMLYPPALVSITATDKYTVVFKSGVPSLLNVENRADSAFNPSLTIVAREVIEKYGDARDWENAVGTGPFILEDHVSDTSYTYVRNPNYWGYSEWYPQDRLPYADEVKFLIIPDFATRLAALRTGKIDLLEGLNWEQAGSLADTNPELLQVSTPSGKNEIQMRCDTAPFNDIRVRKAMNMAIDRETICETYFGGHADPTQNGHGGHLPEGWYTPFDEQPKEVQEGYAYNPEGAKKLLADAGYPNGFETNVVTSGGTDILEIAQAYFAEIGVNMEIRLVDRAAYLSFIREGKQDAMCIFNAPVATPRITIFDFYSKNYNNYTHNNDPVYDEYYNKFTTASDWDTVKIVVREANDRAISQHWVVVLAGISKTFCVYQPYLKGYAGEKAPTSVNFARWWIDQDLKKAMGR